MKKLITILVIVAALIGYVLITAHFNSELITEEPKTEEQKWCFKELMPYGKNMTIVEDEAGHYQYQLYAAEQGVEVWVTCK